MSDTQEALASDDSQQRAATAGARAALIERFGIRGLYGYRTISLSSKYAATILIAKNGTGKTTLLGALDAFLKLQLYRLRGLEFTEIFCKMRGIESEIVLTHDDLVEFLQLPSDSEFSRLTSRVSVEPTKLFQFLLSGYESSFDDWHNDYDPKSLINVIVSGFSHDFRAARKACDDVYAGLFRRSDRLDGIRRNLNTALEGHEIVYLPTYRRVELALTEETEGRRRPGSGKPKLSIASNGLHTGEI